MIVDKAKIRSFRLHAHHLDHKRPMGDLLTVAGACGLQNTPPGAWESALFNRLENCTLSALQKALYENKTLLQAWSYRGVPVVFPTEESGIFLTPLIAQVGEQPWVYTQGITGALEHLQMPFDDLLTRTKQAAHYLDSHTVKSKEALDRILADIIHADLPRDKQRLWCDPSMYGSPDKQTVGGAAVSFLLRPCSFYSLVVFGRRQGVSPTFTSFTNWTGRKPKTAPDRALARKFLHCYGPATTDSFVAWLGCSPRQGKRLWAGVQEELEPLEVAGKTRYILREDRKRLAGAESDRDRLVLLGAHDPYLDMRDRDVILSDKARQKTVWKLVANPGVVLKGGRIIGTWKTKTQQDKLNSAMVMWETITMAEEKLLKSLAEEYAVFRQLTLHEFALEEADV